MTQWGQFSQCLELVTIAVAAYKNGDNSVNKYLKGTQKSQKR